MKIKIYSLFIVLLLGGGVVEFAKAQNQPVVSDSRVKTFVYNPNDVYSLLTHHGYQAHLEFSPKESIQTISLGDKTAWQIIASGRRLFVRPLVGGARTNLTVITNLRSYLFDIQSTKGDLPRREDLVYLVRFYYPDEYINRSATSGDLPAIYPDQMQSVSSPQNQLPALNFEYSFSGEPANAPVKVFDDGASTYFKFKSAAKISVVSKDGQKIPVKYSPTSDGFMKVQTLSDRFYVEYENGGSIEIFNEKMIGGNV
jgi:type IV secretion system protein VirB9